MSVEKTYTEFLREIFHKAYILKSGHTLPIVNSPDYSVEFNGNYVEIVKLEVALNEAKAHTGEVLKMYRENEWRAHTASLHPLKQLPKVLRQKYGLPFCTQAYCKFTEILAQHPVLAEIPVKSDEFRTFHLCEAPGGFVVALRDFLGESRIGNWKWRMNTLNPYNEFNNPASMLLDDTIICRNLDKMEFGQDDTGDILNWSVEFILNLPKFHLVTADGSFDVRDEPENQESLVFPLISKEVMIALHCLEPGGNFVFKLFTFFNQETIHLLNKLLHLFYEVVIRKPSCSKASNSEVYVICIGFNGNTDSDCVLTNGYYHKFLDCARFFCIQQENAIRFNLETFNNLSVTEKCFINEKNFEAITRWQELNLNILDQEKPEIVQILSPWANDSWHIDTNKWQEVIQKGKDLASSKFPSQPVEIYWAMDSLTWLIDAGKPDVVVVKKVDEKAKIRHSLFVNSYLLRESVDKNLVDFAQGPHYAHHVPPKAINEPILSVDAFQMDKRSWLELMANLSKHENCVEELRILARQNNLMLSRFAASTFVLLSVIFNSVQFEETGVIVFKNKLNVDSVLTAAEKYITNLLNAYFGEDEPTEELLRFVPMECFHRSEVYNAISFYNNKKCLDLTLSA
uniref:Cap-specific mRNA (nucleoside-2'-O-)-methyltransferase 2 n=1 Tax=Acrobeloides nanus TaxID=290746 RepID=A0A914CYS3_9BILA